MATKQTAVLKIYFGKEILMKADRTTVANQNQNITLTYNDLQWKAHLENIKKMGICKVEVVQLIQDDQEVEVPAKLKTEIEALLKTPEALLTPEQQKIKDLEAKVEALLAGNANQTSRIPVGKKEETQIDKDLSEMTEKYKAKFNKDVPVRFKNDIDWINKELEKQL